MADPITLALGATAVSALGKGIGVYQGAQAAQVQAQILEQEGKTAEAIGSHKAQEQMRKARYLQSTQLARSAASGGGTGGSSAAVMAETAGRGVLNANLAQWQASQAAQKYNYEAGLKRAEARITPLAGALDVGSSILTGVSGAAKLPGWDNYWGDDGATRKAKPRGTYF